MKKKNYYIYKCQCCNTEFERYFDKRDNWMTTSVCLKCGSSATTPQNVKQKINGNQAKTRNTKKH